MSRFLVTPEARADLFAIWEHVAEDSLDAADRVISEIEESFGKLAEMPGIGHFRDDLLDHHYKFWSVYSYVIAYQWEASPIQIIAIIHGARDLDAFFGQRENIQ
ncbi:MAG: type II toxin-antitoxin system RelE/ParE family toxin [Tepidisphaeraceae bacterium]|jgi:plasmid stabilization system protein ParE